LNLDEKRRTDNFVIDTDDFGMENIFEQMRKYKGNGKVYN
jgi:hypothetical protein